MFRNRQSLNAGTEDQKKANTPKWMSRLANLISRAFYSADVLAPIGCHFHPGNGDADSQAEVTLFVSGTEVMGGACDGRVINSRFMLDLREVMEAFELIESCYWQAQRMADDDQVGPHFGVEGLFEGHRVWLRVAAEPPAQFEPGRLANLHANNFENQW